MKEIALIIDSLDKSFSEEGINGGGNKVSRHLVLEWAKNPEINLDVYSSKSSVNNLDGVREIINSDWHLYGEGEQFFSQLKELLNGKNYDAVIFNDIFAEEGHLILNCNSLPYRYSNCKNFLLSIILKFLKRKKIAVQKRFLQNKNRKFFAVSNIVKEDYAKNFGIPYENIFTAYPGVEMPMQDYQKKKNSVFTFGIVNSGGYNKGIYTLISSLKLLKRTQIPFKLKLIYPKYNNDSFFKFYLKLNRLEDEVEILEFQKNMTDFYNSIDCLLLPSFSEAFGLVVLEAASFSTPSIVSSTSGVSEIILDKENGFLFSMKNNRKKNLFKKMKEVINLKKEKPDEFEKVQKNAHETAQKYSWKNFADSIANNL